MRHTLIGAALSALVLFVSSTPARAGLLFEAVLNGANEVPARDTPATGFGTFTLNDAETELTFSVSFQDLLAPLAAAHFHNQAIGVNGPIVRGLDAEAPIGSTSGIIAGVWKNSDAQALTPTLVEQLKLGRIYINLHTSVFPGGEIRGQLFAVPEPSALALTGLGLVAVVGLARRRTRTGTA